MPGAGTDKTRNWIAQPAPIVVLVEPQLGENIGAAARAMANFGLSRLRIVKPVQGWPNDKARMMASGADRVLDEAQVFETLAEAIADCTFVAALTARGLIGPTEHGHYTIDLPNVTKTTYTARAVAVKGQLEDETCRTFTVDELGVTKALSAGGVDNTALCWR